MINLITASTVKANFHSFIHELDILNQVTNTFYQSASTWTSLILHYATWLFWTLGLISLTWTMGMLMLRRADISDFFAEFVRFTLFFGFYLWLLRNGPTFAQSILTSMIMMGAQATHTNVVGPSNILDVGFDIFFKTLDYSSIWHPITSVIGLVLSGGVLIITAIIAGNMTVLLCAGWILLYGGVFFLGFGGSRWTSDIALNYYKAVLGVAAQLMTMVLIISVATSIINTYHLNMQGTLEFKPLTCILVVGLILLMLVNKVPGMVAGIITGASLSGPGGLPQFGSGAAANTVALLASTAGTTGTILQDSMKNMAGGLQALQAAYHKAQEHRTQQTSLFQPGQDMRSNNPTSSSSQSSFATAMSTGGRLIADIGANLVQGSKTVAQAKLASIANSAEHSISKTIGGQIASAINAQNQAQQSNTISAGPLKTSTKET